MINRAITCILAHSTNTGIPLTPIGDRVYQDILTDWPTLSALQSSPLMASLSSHDLALARERFTFLMSKNPQISGPRRADLLYGVIHSALFNWRPDGVELMKVVLSYANAEQRKALLQDRLLLFIVLEKMNSPYSQQVALAMMQFLIDQGLNFEVHNVQYETPLIVAAQHQFEEMYQLLLKAGANPDARDVYGRSAKEIHDSQPRTNVPNPQPTALASAMP